MKIINTTAVANGTKVYSDDGEDLTNKLNIAKIDICIQPGEPLQAVITCNISEMELDAQDAE